MESSSIVRIIAAVLALAPASCSSHVEPTPTDAGPPEIDEGQVVSSKGGDLGRGLAVDGDHLYFALSGGTDGSTGTTIASVSTRDGTASLVGELGDVAMTGVAVDESHLYTRTLDAIYRVSKTGGTPEAIVATQEHGLFLTLMVGTDFALDDQFVYFGNGEQATLARAPKSGGPPSTLVAGRYPVTQAVIAGGAVWFGYSEPLRIAACGGILGPCDPPKPLHGGFARYDLATEQVTTIADGLDEGAYAVAASAGAVYFTRGEGTMALAVDSDTPARVLDFAPRLLVADGHALYWMRDWIGEQLAEVGKTDLSTREEHVFARGKFNPGGLAVDDRFVYWSKSGELRRAAK